MRDSTRTQIRATLYLTIILFITLLSRTPGLIPSIKITPLWSYMEWLHGNSRLGRSILLNVTLFVPLGYLFVSQNIQWGKCLLLSFLVSAFVEILQYVTYRGIFDFDDLFSNSVGAMIGILIYQATNGREKRIVSSFFLLAGFLGCLYTVQTADKIDSTTIRQLQFDVTSIEYHQGALRFSGHCSFYNRDIGEYTIQLKGKDELIPTKTAINGMEFLASAVIDETTQYEILVKLKDRKTISTSTYITKSSLSYVSGDIPMPAINGTELEDIIKESIQKAYSKDFDTYVYQDGNRLIWLIGSDLDNNTEIIYHLYTNEVDKLPQNRRQYQFDNQGFRGGRDNELTGVMECGKYRVFEKDIPSEYNVTAICVGFNIDGGATEWEDYFRMSKQK